MNAGGNEESDATIVGAGPSGAIAAQVLAKAGMSVVCLEQGEYPDYTSIRFDEPGFELRKDMGFGFNPNRRRMPSDYPIEVSDSDINPLMWNGVGGGTVIYAGAWNRFQPSNFKVRTLDGVAADWPLTYVDRDTGRTHAQKSRIVLLCANGIGTPRLMLNSATAKFPTGLANGSDLVGRNLMLHPFTTVTGLFDEILDSWQGTAAQRAYCLEFAETGADRGFLRGAKLMLMPTGSPLGSIGQHPWGRETDWGEDFHRTVHQRFGRSAIWDIIAEDLPFPHNRVTLDPEPKDEDGIPAPKVSYRYDDDMHRLQKFMQEKAVISMREAGAYETLVAPPLRETGWHILGTVRMGDDPETSVVDGYGRAHDCANLFVIDGSVMPTSGTVNPTATVAALALRNAEAIVRGRRDQPF